jgi:hypothetical protein
MGISAPEERPEKARDYTSRTACALGKYDFRQPRIVAMGAVSFAIVPCILQPMFEPSTIIR